MAVGMEVREVENDWNSCISSYGCIDGGFELARLAWSKLEHRFSVRRDKERVDQGLADAPGKVFFGHHRYPQKLLQKLPVDLLIVERGHLFQPIKNYSPEPWEDLVKSTRVRSRPKVILESWSNVAQTWTRGPVCKATITRWQAQGYATRCQLLRATKFGGAIQQSRFLVVRILGDLCQEWHWPQPEKDSEFVRPMSNLLTPPGLLRAKTNKFVQTGIDPILEPMPCRPGLWIKTKGGSRRLQPDEVSRGLGLPKDAEVDLDLGLLERSTCIFIWEALVESLKNLRPKPGAKKTIRDTDRADRITRMSGDPELPASELFHWRPPDLRPGGTWHQQRLLNLKAASLACPDPTQAYEDGLKSLKIHRTNYNAEGPAPTQLQLLWWEFPKEHWTALREGSRMNFLKSPSPEMKPNAVMDDEQLAVAAAFVDELLVLKVLHLLDDGEAEILLNAPLFVVPKEGQPGEWRVIADMLRGGQNMCIGNDPTVLPRISHILDLMYEGGYSGVVDASKFFYQFKTHPDDQKYLGLVHPITGIPYAYGGLPMGAGQSPSLACRYGLAFLRTLRGRYEEFQGSPRANCWWTGFSEIGFDPELGYGFILEARDGPAVKIWAWVDDFLIHGPTLEKTNRALSLFLDIALDCGLLCHPKKLTPPCQAVKYCGFILDSRGIPCLRIPVVKRERALAMVEYVLESHSDKLFSRLALSVIAGTLQSLVEATPHHNGHTKLRRFHTTVRPSGLGTGAEPYFTKTTVDASVRVDLRWWKRCLIDGRGRFARSKHSATLVPTWGDGSGTGTGGTFLVPDGALKMWKGKWVPFVYKFSSNWKELMTLKLTLLHIKKDNAESICGTTVFYFTDNSSVYWIASSGSSSSPALHKLIEEIRALCFELDCILQVVHVPGFVMITQGTDGLSRGVWMTPLQELDDPHALTRSIFDPLPFDPALVDHYIDQLPFLGLRQPLSRWQYQDWSQTWDAEAFFNVCTVWFPPPEVARQAITFSLEAWSERPLTTSFIFFVPRVVPAFWYGLSRHVHELGTIYPHKTPLRYPPRVCIPVIVLYIAPHERSLPTKDRLARTALPSNAKWHQRQATSVRGLQPVPIQ
jgi:hypothetical protein